MWRNCGKFLGGQDRDRIGWEVVFGGWMVECDGGTGVLDFGS